MSSCWSGASATTCATDRPAEYHVVFCTGPTYVSSRLNFVAIIGANGSSKSTLMNIMAGRKLPCEGAVLLNDRDLHANFQTVKQDIAFVPQQDVLHEQLTLRQALDYTAQLRLPPDTTVEQRHAAVNDAARSVDLLDRLDQHIGALSGGQKKCASLANEILNRPSLLLLDEVSSGLDESADWQIMRLLRSLADDGITIIVVTHTLANVTEFCDKVICMGRGGQPTFVGAPSEALEFFSVHRLGEVFDRTDELGAGYWRARFEATIGTTINLPNAAEARGDARHPALQHPRDPVFVALLRSNAPSGHSTTSEYDPAALRSSYAADGCCSERAHRWLDGLRVRSLWDGTGACKRGERSSATAWAERDLARLQQRVEGYHRRTWNFRRENDVNLRLRHSLARNISCPARSQCCNLLLSMCSWSRWRTAFPGIVYNSLCY